MRFFNRSGPPFLFTRVERRNLEFGRAFFFVPVGLETCLLTNFDSTNGQPRLSVSRIQFYLCM
jgi:hypothetical protein